MQNLRIKLLLAFITLLTALTIWTWIKNAQNVDIALTKNIHYQNRWRVDIEQSTDALFLRAKALQLIDTFNEKSIKTNTISGQVQGLLTWLTLVSLFALVLATVECFKRTKNGRQR